MSGLPWNPSPKATATVAQIDAGTRCVPAALPLTVAHIAEDWREHDGHWPRQTACGLPFHAAELWTPLPDTDPAPACTACAAPDPPDPGTPPHATSATESAQQGSALVPGPPEPKEALLDSAEALRVRVCAGCVRCGLRTDAGIAS